MHVSHSKPELVDNIDEKHLPPQLSRQHDNMSKWEGAKVKIV